MTFQDIVNDIKARLQEISGLTVYFDNLPATASAFPVALFYLNKKLTHNWAGGIENYEVQINGQIKDLDMTKISNLSHDVVGKMEMHQIIKDDIKSTPFEQQIGSIFQTATGQYQLTQTYTFTV